MTLYDRQRGLLDGTASGANVAARRYEQAIDEWEVHANKLQAKLQAATNNVDELAKQRLFALAQLEGQTAVMQALKSELERVCPNSLLLRDDGRRTNIARTAMAQFLKRNGYDYDPKTQSVRKI